MFNYGHYVDAKFRDMNIIPVMDYNFKGVQISR